MKKAADFVARHSLALGVFASPWVATPRKGRVSPASAQASSDFATRSDLRSDHNFGLGFAEGDTAFFMPAHKKVFRNY